MTTDQIRAKFLANQFKEAMALAQQSDILKLYPAAGSPPERYLASFRAKGLVRTGGKIVDADRCDIGINFPDDYLRRVHAPEVLAYLGPHPEPWHPNMRFPFVCVHLRPATSLVEILLLCYELWTWQVASTRDDGLNPAASQWARHQPKSRFPIDRRPLKRRELELHIEKLSEVARP
jgi:hypothetical protein